MAGDQPRRALTQTRRGKKWLANYSDVDREFAGQLLESLHFASIDTIRSEVAAAVEAFVLDNEGRALIVAARDEKDLPRLKNGGHHVAFKTFKPSDPFVGPLGSEGFFDQLVRDLNKTLGNAVVTGKSAESVDGLRAAETQTIVMVTDYVGTGNQIAGFAKIFLRHERLRSWRSLGWMRMVVISYAVSPDALTRLQRTGSPVDEVRYIQIAPDFATSGWSQDVRNEIERVCVDYGDGRDDALGYLGSRGLFASAMTVPNNLPLVLRKSAPGWQSFFEGRTVPTDVARGGPTVPLPIRLRDILSRIGQDRLSRAVSVTEVAPWSDELRLVLALSRRKPRSVPELVALTQVPTTRIKKALRTLESLGQIDSRGLITTLGIEELKAGRRARRILTAGLVGSEEPYYPVLMR